MSEKKGVEKRSDKQVVPGWYVFQDGKIKGPLSAPEAFKIKHDPGSSERYVSRVGFQRWYPVEQLNPLLKEVQRIEAASERSNQEFEEALSRNLDRLSERASDRKKERPQVAAKSIPAKRESLSQNRAQSLDSHNPHPTMSSQTAISTQATMIDHKLDPAPPLDTSAAAVAASDADAADRFAAVHQPTYMTLKGRLRLGRIKPALQLSLLEFSLSAGLVWIWWFRRMTLEVNYHAHNAYQHENLKRWWLAMIPLLHCLASYRLARELATMEKQNGYQATKPGLAAALSLVPPFLMFYLQRRANDHWRLHVEHIQKQQAA